MKMSVKECAELLKVSESTIRAGLKAGVFEFGYAIKLSSKYHYIISRKKFMKAFAEEED